jgi:hypothetical protein
VKEPRRSAGRKRTGEPILQKVTNIGLQVFQGVKVLILE